MRYPKNADIAQALNRIADLLEVQGANPFRVSAYCRAAKRINAQEQDVAARILSKADDDLENLPDIGCRIAGTIREFVQSGRIAFLDHLEGQVEPERLFMTVPNIGRKLARRIHHALDIDTLDELKRIAPRRFNPDVRAWLPILHTDRDGWEFTAAFSNTARAHKLGRTHDWVVIYGYRDGEETQHTIVTEQRGPLAGRRVVRGRESECRRYYEQTAKH